MDASPANNGHRNMAGRIVAAVGYAVFLIVVGVLVPPRWKLYGIYPLLLGGLLGGGIGKLFTPVNRPLRIVIPLLILLSIVVWNGQHLWLHEQYSALLRKSFEADPTRDWGLEESAAPPADESDSERRQRENFQKELARIEGIRTGKTSFQGYLIARGRPLGISSTVGAWSLYCVEMVLLIFGSLGAFVYLRK